MFPGLVPLQQYYKKAQLGRDRVYKTEILASWGNIARSSPHQNSHTSQHLFLQAGVDHYEGRSIAHDCRCVFLGLFQGS